MNCLSCTVFR